MLLPFVSNTANLFTTVAVILKFNNIMVRILPESWVKGTKILSGNFCSQALSGGGGGQNFQGRTNLYQHRVPGWSSL